MQPERTTTIAITTTRELYSHLDKASQRNSSSPYYITKLAFFQQNRVLRVQQTNYYYYYYYYYQRTKMPTTTTTTPSIPTVVHVRNVVGQEQLQWYLQTTH